MIPPRKDPWLLTPGPITTSPGVKQAMQHDWGSRDQAFVALTARVRDRLTALAGGTSRHVCVPVQGAGTFALEAALGTLIPRDGRVLVLVNGAYGRRLAKICGTIGRDCASYEVAENTVHDPGELARRLAADPSIGFVAMVHSETTTGLLNPVADMARVVAGAGRRLILDSISAFGALDLDVTALPCPAMIGSTNKCLESVPGMAFVIVETAFLEASAGNACSLSLDLYTQWQALEKNGQWLFTPPTHVVAALDRALEEHAAEGGIAGRLARYQDNLGVLVGGMRNLGFEPFLPDDLQAPIIVTFHAPDDTNYDFETFYGLLAQTGYLIYPGKLTEAETFRMGCIGRLGVEEMRGAIGAVAAALEKMGVKNRGRKAA